MATRRSFPSPPRRGKLNAKNGRDKHLSGVMLDQSGRYLGISDKLHAAASDWKLQDKSAHEQGNKAYAVTTHYASAVTTGVTPRTLKGVRIVSPEKAFYPKEIFDSQAEYDASVDSVVARIKSGQIQPREPDPDEEEATDKAKSLERPRWQTEVPVSQSARIQEVITTLAPEQRQVIELLYFDGLSQMEVAAKLNMPLGAVKSRARIAIRRLALLIK